MKNLSLASSVILAIILSFNMVNAQDISIQEHSLQDEVITIGKLESEPKQGSAQRIPFQGRLFQNGEPVSGHVKIVFSIDGIGWNETHENVFVSEGLYSVELGSAEPLPSSLFYGVESRELVISIDDTPLDPVTIYPTYTGNTFLHTVDPESETYALTATVSGEGDSETWYFGGRSFAEVGDGRLIGHYGRAVGNNTAYGIYGQGTSSSKYSFGVYGIVNGEGDGSVHDFSGETPVWGSSSFGVRGASINNLHENIGVMGNAYGFKGVTNKGLLGKSNVNNGDDIDNTGVFAEASGSGINRGVWAHAFNGTENWAGWFEGDVKITGNLIVDGEGGGGGNGFQLPDNVYIANEEGESVKYAGQLNLHGHGTPNIEMGGHWHNKDLPVVFLRGSQQHVDEWFHPHLEFGVDDNVDQQWGYFNLWGNEGNNNVQFGTYHWEPFDGANRPFMSMTGNEHEHVRMGVGYDGTSGEEFGYFALRGGKGHDIISFGSLHWEGENASNRPFMTMKGNNHEENLVWLSVNDDGAGGEHAFLSLNGTDDAHAHFSPSHYTINIPGHTLVQLEKRHDGDPLTEYEYADLTIRDTDGNETTIRGDGNIWTSHVHTNALDATGTITCENLTETSDITLKTNVLPLNNTLQNIQKLRGVSFNWADANKPQSNQIGLIAQEIEEVYPEFVHTKEDGLKAVNYSQMTAVLIEAVKELNSRIEELEEQNLALQRSLKLHEELSREIVMLKSLVLGLMGEDTGGLAENASYDVETGSNK